MKIFAFVKMYIFNSVRKYLIKGVYEGALFIKVSMHDTEFPFLGLMHFEARLDWYLFYRQIRVTFTSIHKMYFLHANEISTYDDYNKIKLDFYCSMILSSVA